MHIGFREKRLCIQQRSKERTATAEQNADSDERLDVVTSELVNVGVRT